MAPGFGGVGDLGVGEIDSPGSGGASSSPATSFKKNSPGCGCCCSCTTNCDGDTPCRWTLTVDGVDYTVRRPTRGTTEHGSDGWNLKGPHAYRGCTFEYLELGLESDGDLRAAFWSPTTSANVVWQVRAGNPFDCTDSYSLPYLSSSAGSSGCTISGTPGTMTATPSRFRNCASASSCDCAVCETDPGQWKVVLSGIRGTGSGYFTPCADCTSLNGTYYLDPAPIPSLATCDPGPCCVWLVQFTSTCGYDTLSLLVVTGGYYLTLCDSSGTQPSVYWFDLGETSPRDCLAVTDFALTPGGAAGNCWHFDNNALITGIP